MPDEKDFRKWQRVQARQHRRASIEELVDFALVYHEETLRDDPAHKARLATRRRALVTMIEQAYKAIHPDPPTKSELEFDRAIWRAEQDGG